MLLVDVAGAGKQGFRPELLKVGLGDDEEEAMAMDEENPDDAAIGNTGVGVIILPVPCICHAQFDEIASALICIALPCHVITSFNANFYRQKGKHVGI